MSEAIIKAQKLCVRAGKRYLLNEISWEVARGEHWLVFGLNGSGKTTLLSAIAGFRPPDSGTLEVLGQTYDEKNILAIRRRIGWVSSSFFDKCYCRESALDIVLSGVFGTMGLDFAVTDSAVRKAHALLGELRMGDKMQMPFDLLSKGERQNVLIARALIAEPEILVLDEPGTGLDVYAREHMLGTVRDLAQEQAVTIIYVTHYPEEIQPFMQKTLLMRGGRVFAQGDTDAVMTAEHLSAVMNEAAEVLREPSGCMRLRLDAPTGIRQICYPQEVLVRG